MRGLRVVPFAVSLMSSACASDLCADYRDAVGEARLHWNLSTSAPDGTPANDLEVFASVTAAHLDRVSEFHYESEEGGTEEGCAEHPSPLVGTARVAPLGAAPLELSMGNSPVGVQGAAFTGLAATYTLTFDDSSGTSHALEWNPPQNFTVEVQETNDGGLRLTTSLPLPMGARDTLSATHCNGLPVAISVTPSGDGQVTTIYPYPDPMPPSLSAVVINVSRFGGAQFCGSGTATSLDSSESVPPWGCQWVTGGIQVTAKHGC
jgi:hypothetical protein